MSSSPKKEKIIQGAIAVSKENKLINAFLQNFYRQVPVEDLAGWKAEDLSVVARSMCDWGAEKKTGTHKVRVFNPEKKRDGWHIPHTVIGMVSDDMPFIIDTVTSELSQQGLNVEVLFHPVLSVLREKGQMKDIAAGKDRAEGFAPESFVYIQLEQMLTSDACKKLATMLSQRFDDIRAATTDWKTMLKKVDDVTAHISSITGHEWNDVKEARDFLGYIRANNFTFLGYREYKFSGGQSKVIEGSNLGVLKNITALMFENGAEIKALEATRWPVMVCKLIDFNSTVHRPVPMDAIAMKIVDAKGNLSGMHFFVGLFTSSTYSCRTGEVPLVRQKVAETVAKAGFTKGSHDAKALEHILEKMPRDELFQVSSDELFSMALGILRLQAKQRIALFTHMDPVRRHMSCLIYVPRDRYNTKFRLAAAKILEQSLGGRVTNYFTTLDDSTLARVLFTVRLEKDAAAYDHAQTEQRLVDMGREWDERLKHVLIDVYGKIKGTELAFTYGRAFPSAYHESIDIKNAVHDIRQLEALQAGSDDIRVDFYRLSDAAAGSFNLKVYHKGAPVPLSDILPKLENMGLKALSEMPYEVKPHDGGKIWIHDFVLKGADNIDFEKVKSAFEETFLQVWKGHAEDDGLNALVLRANLDWREVMILRTYSSYMRQARLPYSRTYVEQVLSAYPAITREIVAFFKTLHDPKEVKKVKADGQKIIDMLQDVQKLDHDRILRTFKMLTENTLRTNYFQKDEKGAPKSTLAVKLDSKNIPDLPLPRPHVEIFVYSPRVEAVHLRGGEIARGGIRWSDRHDDFRTEVLGLMKSQMVKNTVIVPVGAKGGFVVKQPPKEGGREAYSQEGIECYKIFVQTLLDLTDNNVKGKIVRPKDVVCHDGIDPYLVVAADKGTATFSDIANALSLKSGFWLGDAFASGGGTGYDHKKIAITARGGWESVKRHFRELGKDIQKEPFTLVGVGDMAGDVFGNAMLLSTQMKLVGAFNHVHIFCDPEPDIAASFAERERMFKTRGGWDTYDKSKISAGGGVFERSAKSLKISPQIKKRFGLTHDSVTPDDLIKAILRAEVEMIWFGGIGTFVKSSKQSHADADDKSNDALRIDANEIRAKVVGEGANLGTTQLSRVEYARSGGRINTDFIDNSGGVDCSDHEVNIKILLADVVGKGKLNLAQRNKLLVDMTDDVAKLVLRDNYQQTQAISLQMHAVREHVGLHAEFVRSLERDGLIKRSLEGLPDEEGFARLQRDGQGLTRPELAILTSYAKIVLYKQVLKSSIPDDAAMEGLLFDYFPKALHKFDKEIKVHKLRREIIAAQIVNMLVNRMGPVFVSSRVSKTGASAEEVIKAFMIVQEALVLKKLWADIEALDNKVSSQVQIAALHELFQTAKRAVTWFLRLSGGPLDMARETGIFAPGMATLRASIGRIIPEGLRNTLNLTQQKMTEWQVPRSIAEDISVANILSSAGAIINIAQKSKGDLKAVAKTYFDVGEGMGLDWLRGQLSDLKTENQWQARVKGGLMDDLFHHQAVLASRGKAPDAAVFAKAQLILTELRVQEKVTLEMIILASQRIGQMIGQV